MARARPRKTLGSGDAPRDRGVKTETRILDAAEQVFARVGFAGASTQEIAEAAGVTKAMIHYYFDSKERLYRGVLDRLLLELIHLTQEVTVANIDRVERLKTFLNGFIDYVARHPHFGRLTYMGSGSESHYFETIVTTFFRPLFERGVQHVEAGIEERIYRRVDAGQLLLSIYTVTMGYFADAHFISLILQDEALGKERLEICRNAIVDMVLRTLGVHDAPPTTPDDQTP